MTGSGKTEIYLQAIEHALHQGKDSIVLVPEISLTPQTVERFRARFQNQQITVLHSNLSAGERHDQWHKIRDGQSHIVIGARSAVFAPVQALGLIVIDEEHETSYKQEEAPRYNARDIAVMRAKIERAAVVLGSATPSLESFYNAQRGRYTLADAAVARGQPEDAGHAHRRHAPGSDPAERACTFCRANCATPSRRGSTSTNRSFCSSIAAGTRRTCSARSAGTSPKCPNCSVSLTYHRKAAQLLCHLCGYVGGVPKNCPECRDPAIRYAGMGTEKVESAIQQAFPKARVQRMDSDMMTRKTLYREILGAFRVGKIDILVGTQMIAKGLHFPNVTLVGIIYADMALHLPDFRAGERTFQLLVQVAGRAGRGDVEGEVVVQSFTPFHSAVQYARQHDFIGFYEQEIEFREQLRYPPVSRLVCITARSRSEAKASFYRRGAGARTARRRVPDTSGCRRRPDAGAAGESAEPVPFPDHAAHAANHAGRRSRRTRCMASLKPPEDVGRRAWTSIRFRCYEPSNQNVSRSVRRGGGRRGCICLAYWMPKLNPDVDMDSYRSSGAKSGGGKGFVATGTRWPRVCPTWDARLCIRLFLAGLIKLGGDRLGMFLTVQCVLWGVISWLTILLAARWLPWNRAAVAPGSLVAFDPNAVMRGLDLRTETLFTLLLLGGMCVLAWRNERPWGWFWAGVLWSLASLCRPIAAWLWVVALDLTIVWQRGRRASRCFSSGFCRYLGLWVARNAAVTGQWFFSTNATDNLLESWAAGVEAKRKESMCPWCSDELQTPSRHGRVL